MAVPTRVEAASLLLSLEPPPWHLRHSRAVAEVASFLAARVAERSGCGGHRGSGRRPDGPERMGPAPVDRLAVEAAALLHDTDKALPADDEVRRRFRHGDGSAAWLAARGYGELGPLVAAHPVTRLVDEAWFHDVLMAASIEVRIVAYADKRAGQRLEPMTERFASWERRYPPEETDDPSRASGRSGAPDQPATDTTATATADARGHRRDGWSREMLRAVRERARELEASVCEAAGIDPDEVRRTAWTGRALLDARRTGMTANAAR